MHIQEPDNPEPETVGAISDMADRRRGSVVQLSGGRLLAAGLALISGPLMARALNPSGRGEFASATVYAAIVTAVVSTGVPAALGHAVANRRYPKAAVLATASRFCALLTFPCVLAAFAIITFPLSGLSLTGRVGAFLLVALVPVGVLATCLVFVLMGEGALRSMTATQVMPALIFTLAIACLYLVGWLTLAGAIAVTIGVSLVRALVGWRSVGLRPSGRVPTKPIASFAMRGFAGNLATFATISLDQAVIAPVLGFRELGFYAVAATIATLPHLIGVAISSRAFAEVAKAERDQRGMIAWRYVRLTLLATLPVGLVVGALSPALLPVLYGDAFRPSVVPLLLLLPGTIALSMSATTSSCLNASGRPGRGTIAEVLGFIVTVAGLPLVIPQFGIVGAAVLSTSAYTVTLAANVTFLRVLRPVALKPRVDDFTFLLLTARQYLSAMRRESADER